MYPPRKQVLKFNWFFNKISFTQVRRPGNKLISDTRVNVSPTVRPTADDNARVQGVHTRHTKQSIVLQTHSC